MKKTKKNKICIALHSWNKLAKDLGACGVPPWFEEPVMTLMEVRD